MSLWTHTTRRTKFCLCVDDFGVKYFSKEDALHLIDALKQGYPTSVDWDGKNYCGYTFDWNYEKGYVDVSMPTYIPKMLRKFNHKKPSRPQRSPHSWSSPTYGQKRQYAKTNPDLPLLPKPQVTEIQQKSGSMLYYARALEYTMLPALSDIATTQAKPTTATEKEVEWLMDYCATYPHVKIRFFASKMILHVHSDASYLTAPGAKSRIAGYYYLSNEAGTLDNPPFYVLCQLLKTVLASAAEAETAGVFFNAREIIYLRRHLETLGHPQPPTILTTDNSTTAAFAQNNLKMKKSKSWDMRYFWLRQEDLEKVLRVKWDSGKNIKADYFTKHFPPSYHVRMRPTLFLPENRMNPRARVIKSLLCTLKNFPVQKFDTCHNRRTILLQPRTPNNVDSILSNQRRNLFPQNSPTLRGCVGTKINCQQLNTILARSLTSAHNIA